MNPFRNGEKWRLKSDPNAVATVTGRLFSRVRRNTECHGKTEGRIPGVHYPFPADDPHGRGCFIYITTDEWERVR